MNGPLDRDDDSRDGGERPTEGAAAFDRQVAALWEAQGYDVAPHAAGLVAVRDGERRLLETYPEGDLSGEVVDEAVSDLIESTETTHVTLVVGDTVSPDLRERTAEWDVTVVDEADLEELAASTNDTAYIGRPPAEGDPGLSSTDPAGAEPPDPDGSPPDRSASVEPATGGEPASATGTDAASGSAAPGAAAGWTTTDTEPERTTGQGADTDAQRTTGQGADTDAQRTTGPGADTDAQRTTGPGADMDAHAGGPPPATETVPPHDRERVLREGVALALEAVLVVLLAGSVGYLVFQVAALA
jgi:hypothetical protein